MVLALVLLAACTGTSPPREDAAVVQPEAPRPIVEPASHPVNATAAPPAVEITNVLRPPALPRRRGPDKTAMISNGWVATAKVGTTWAILPSVREELDDDELLARWRAGDPAAGERVFSRYVKSLFRFFRSKLDDPIADDLTQTTYLAATNARDSFRGGATVRTFLFAIARKQLLMHFRGAPKRSREVVLDTMSVFDLNPSPSSIPRATEEQRLLLDALRRIPIDFQIAVALLLGRPVDRRHRPSARGRGGHRAQPARPRARARR